VNILFFTIFILFPVAEVIFFIHIWGEIGFFMTMLLLFVMTAVGISLVRFEGMRTLLNLERSLRTGTIPDKDVFNAVCVALAGALMILPGFLSDVLGFLLLMQPVRTHLHTVLARSQPQRHPRSPTADSSIIEGEYETLDE
jgi:UPF0716 protein FxsA